MLRSWCAIGFKRHTYRSHEGDGQAHAARGLHDERRAVQDFVGGRRALSLSRVGVVLYVGMHRAS